MLVSGIHIPIICLLVCELNKHVNPDDAQVMQEIETEGEVWLGMLSPPYLEFKPPFDRLADSLLCGHATPQSFSIPCQEGSGE